ncbi:MAG TPA: protein kinase, partial [Sandaracinaceae bacterium]
EQRPEPEPAPALDRRDPEALHEALGAGPSPGLDEDAVLDAIEALREKGREARAIDLARRVLLHHPDRLRVHQRVAEMLASRGDDAGAARLLEPFVERADAPLDLWMLAAEIAERRGDAARALALYERVVARDLDYPRARARVRRLREGRERREADLGATLMADGALTRGRYRVERELGRGGAGTVFLADDLSLGRKVALKVYHRRGRAERSRLLAEARVPARLEHPGIVRIFDLDEALAAVAMERVLGGSVRQELKKGGLPLARIVRWLVTSAEALAYVHEAGIVHRDIKPSNMLLRADDRVVLTDFGVAAEVGKTPQAAGEGTLGYMPAEQRAGAPAHPSMDIHAFGASMKEILDHASSAPPEELRELSAACMRSDPEARPTAAWLAERLRSA